MFYGCVVSLEQQSLSECLVDAVIILLVLALLSIIGGPSDKQKMYLDFYTYNSDLRSFNIMLPNLCGSWALYQVWWVVSYSSLVTLFEHSATYTETT